MTRSIARFLVDRVVCDCYRSRSQRHGAHVRRRFRSSPMCRPLHRGSSYERPRDLARRRRRTHAARYSHGDVGYHQVARM